MNPIIIIRGIAGISFLTSLIVYLTTMAPTVSFWDCGEFIACSYKMAIPHPPGAPFYLMMGRVFTLLPVFEDIAARVNLISVLSGAFTVLFLHLTIYYLVKGYLKSEEGFLKYVPSIGGLIGSLSFAFSHSFWFNTVEAEVYAPSMFFTGLIVWLAFKWAERHDESGNERYIILIAYIIGLALGVHLLNVLAIPAIALIIFYRRYEINAINLAKLAVVTGGLFFLVYPGVVKGLPVVADVAGVFSVILILVALLGLMIWASKAEHHHIALIALSVLLIVVGYSSYMMIFIRSGLDPNIDENNPETIEKFIKYMNREQYGDHSILDRTATWRNSPNGAQYDSVWDFFWNYQVQKMYVRYFNQNFLGITPDTSGVNPTQLWFVPFLLGFLGAIYHFYRDWRHGLVVFVLFFMTGLAIILYLNQPDPQPRERDYSYVGSFFAFAIWIGIGAAALIEGVVNVFKDGGSGIRNLGPVLLSILLVIVGPVKMLAENFDSHDRRGNYVASDYSYNMLINADEGSIMYTNGDNDTFPLWYLQEVEKVRQDVRVANLSLLNTDWYIKQLKNMEPTVPMSLTDEQIDDLPGFLHNQGLKLFGRQEPIYGRIGPTGLFPWPKADQIKIETVSQSVRRSEISRYQATFGGRAINQEESVSFQLRPKHNINLPDGRKLGFLRIQDYMILNTLINNQFQKPIYFAVTSSSSNQLDGLRDYLRMDGLLFKVTTIKNWAIDPEILHDNIMNKFRYRGLNDPSVYFNDSILGLVQNYRSAFFRLANHYLDNGERERFKEVIVKMNDVMPPEVIPYTNPQFAQILEGMNVIAGITPLEEVTADNFSLEELRGFAELGMNFEAFDFAEVAFENLLNAIDNPDKAADVNQFVNNFFRRQVGPDQRLQILTNLKAQIAQQLATAKEKQGKVDEAIELLRSRLESGGDNPLLKAKLDELLKANDQ